MAKKIRDFFKQDDLLRQYQQEIFDYERTACIFFMRNTLVFYPVYGLILFLISPVQTREMIWGLLSCVIFSFFMGVMIQCIKQCNIYKKFNLLRLGFLFTVLAYSYTMASIFLDTSYVLLYVQIFCSALLYLSPKRYIYLILSIELFVQLATSILGEDIGVSFEQIIFFLTEDLLVITAAIAFNIFFSRILCELFVLQRNLKKDRDVDGLTNLVNKRYFEEYLQLCTASHNIGCAVLVDMDHFKEVNDTYGHHTGDLLLKQAAQILVSTFRNGDCIARIGGDEFAVFFTTTAEQERITQIFREKADKLLEQTPIYVGDKGREIAVTFSVGMSACQISDDTSPDHILAMADAAMYQIKNTSRDGAFLDLCGTHTEVIRRRNMYEPSDQGIR